VHPPPVKGDGRAILAWGAPTRPVGNHREAFQLPCRHGRGKQPIHTRRGEAISPQTTISALYFFVFLYLGGAANYLPLWLSSHGWTDAHQGWLWSLRHVALIAFPLLWGRLADRTSPVMALRLIAVGSAVAFLPLVATNTVVPVMVCLGIWGMFRVGIVPVADAWTLATIAEHGGNYGSLRMFGSFGFIAGGLLLGGLVGWLGRDVTVGWLALVLVATAVFTFVARRAKSPTHSEPPWTALGRLVSNRAIRPFLLLAFVYGLSTQGLYIFLPLHLADLGVPDSLVPVFWSVGVASEIWMFRISPKTFETWPPRRTMLMCTVACVLQYGLTSLVQSPWLLFPIMALHGLTFGVFYYTCVLWLGNVIPASDRATAQAVFQSVTFGFGGAISAVAAGYLFEAGRGALLFGVAAGLAAIMVLIAIFGLRQHWNEPLRKAAP
jgi:PPP family 3-phenylpropionic acid transporter